MIEPNSEADWLLLKPKEINQAVIETRSDEAINQTRMVRHQHMVARSKLSRENIAGIRVFASKKNVPASNGPLHTQETHD